MKNWKLLYWFVIGSDELQLLSNARGIHDMDGWSDLIGLKTRYSRPPKTDPNKSTYGCWMQSIVDGYVLPDGTTYGFKPIPNNGSISGYLHSNHLGKGVLIFSKRADTELLLRLMM